MTPFRYLSCTLDLNFFTWCFSPQRTWFDISEWCGPPSPTRESASRTVCPSQRIWPKDTKWLQHALQYTIVPLCSNSLESTVTYNAGHRKACFFPKCFLIYFGMCSNENSVVSGLLKKTGTYYTTLGCTLGLIYLNIVSLLVRDHDHAVYAGKPAVVQQSLLRLYTQWQKAELLLDNKYCVTGGFVVALAWWWLLFLFFFLPHFTVWAQGCKPRGCSLNLWKLKTAESLVLSKFCLFSYK